MTHDGFRAAPNGRRIAVSVLVLVGLLTSACTSPTSSLRPSSSSSSSSSSSVTTATQPGTASGSMVDLRTGEITPLPASIAASGSYYAVSPDHTTVAYNACCAQPGPVRVANLDGTQVRQVTAKGWDAYAAQWSPDGSKLVYQQRHASTEKLGNLFVLDVRTGQRTQITNFDQTKSWDWWFTFPSFSSDGRWILFQLPRGDNTNPIWDLWTVPVTGGQQNLLRRNAGWGGFSPDHKWLAYLSPVDAQSFTGGSLRT